MSPHFPEWINFWLGDAFYSFMMFFIVAFLLVRKPAFVKGIVALIICYCIELSQLLQGEWINSLRLTTFGKLALGSGFLWSDMVAYLVGIIAAYCVETLWFQRYNTSV